MKKKPNISKSDVITIALGGIATIVIDILLRISDNNSREEEIKEAVEEALNKKEEKNED